MIDASSPNNRDNFDNLSENIKEILIYAEDNQIFYINRLNSTIELFNKKSSDENQELNRYSKMLRIIKSQKNQPNFKYELLNKLFNFLYLQDKIYKFVSFEDINHYYNNIFSNQDQKQKQKHFENKPFFTKKDDIDGDSIPRPILPTDDFEAPNIKTLKSFEQFDIWISKKNRDHHTISKATLNSNSKLFQNIVDHYPDRTFDNPSHTAKLILSDERGLRFSSQLYKNGTIMIYHQADTNKLDFLEDFSKEFSFLPKDQYFEFLSLITQKGNYSYILETANRVGPADKVEEHLKGAHLIVRNFFCADGTLADIDVKIDHSLNNFESEITGKPGPSRKLQSSIKDSLAMVQGLEIIEYNLTNISEEIGYIIENENEIENSNLNRHNEIKELLENIDISKIKEKISQINSSIYTLDEKYREMNIEQTEEIKNVIYDNHEELLQGQNYLNGNIVISKDEIKNEIKESTEKIISNNNYSQMSVLYQSAEHQAKNQQNFIQLENEIKESTEKIISNNNYSQMSVLYQSAEHQAKNQSNFNQLEQKIFQNIDLTNELFPGLEIIEDEIITLKNEVREGSKKIIETFEEKLDLLDKKIDEKFDSQNQQFKNNLCLILRALQKIPIQTFKILESELNLKKSTLYYYLKKLREANLIETEKDPSQKKGRPKLFFKLKK